MNSRFVHASWGVLVVAAGLAACSRPEARFRFQHPHKDKELIVTMDSGKSPKELANFLGDIQYTLELIRNQTYLIKFSESVSLEDMASKIAATTGLEKIEANQIYRLDETIPNDPDFSKLYGLKNSGQSAGTVGADIRATQAWDLSTGSSELLIGIIDSGVDYNHPDLQENMWTNPGESGLDEKGRDKRSNSIDDDQNGFVDDFHGWDFYNNDNNPMDDNSHGTHVAGTIGARGNNGRGVVGVNWQVSMVPVKVFSAAGESTTEVLLKGIDYATQLGLVASNNSWGGGGFSQAMYDAIERHTKAGTLFIAAAGNESSNNDTDPHYPSTYDLDGIIAVASSNKRDKISGFSNYGKKSVDVAAPGEDIYSTTPNNTYGMKSGTSMATPHVTGLVALLKAATPSLDAKGLKAKILATSIAVPTLASGVQNGRIDALNALENDSTAPGEVLDVRVESTALRDLNLSWTEAGDDQNTGRATRYLIRSSSDRIEDEASWNLAEELNPFELTAKDGRVFAKITGLPYNTKGYVTFRAVDNVGNIGPISGSQAFELKPITILVSLDNSSLDGWKSREGSWDLAKMDGLSVLSDSPEGRYENNVNAAITTEEITVTSNLLALDIRSRWSLEDSYDFGYIELSRDGGQTWIQLGSLTGVSESWQIKSFALAEVLGDAKSFRIRCRIKSDFSVSGDGWDIDSLQLVSQQ